MRILLYYEHASPLYSNSRAIVRSLGVTCHPAELTFPDVSRPYSSKALHQRRFSWRTTATFTPTHGRCGSKRIEYGRRGESTEAGGGSTERVRSQYGMTSSAASAAYVKHDFTFKIWLRIGTDQSGSAQTQYGYGTDAAWIAADRASAPIRKISSRDDEALAAYAEQGLYATVRRQSVCPVRLLLLRVCCCGPGGQETWIECCTAGARQQRRRSPARSSGTPATGRMHDAFVVSVSTLVARCTMTVSLHLPGPILTCLQARTCLEI